MIVRISYGVEVSDFFRRALAHHYGEEGMASRETIKTWYRAHGLSQDADLLWDFQMAIERGEVKENDSSPQ